jgi:tetratricopeptide (TPR) repeat protein
MMKKSQSAGRSGEALFTKLRERSNAGSRPQHVEAERQIQDIDESLRGCTSPFDRAGLNMQKVALLAVLNRMTDARNAIQTALESSDDPETRMVADYLEGVLCHEEGETIGAYSLLTAALSKHSELLNLPNYRFLHEDIQQRRAFELFALRDRANAVPLLKKILSFELQDRTRAAALANLGNCYAAMKRFEAARNYLEKAIEHGSLHEWEGTVHFDLALTYACLGLLKESKRELQLCEHRAAEYQLSSESIYLSLSPTSEGPTRPAPAYLPITVQFDPLHHARTV